jgi:predicted peroxiredoxin
MAGLVLVSHDPEWALGAAVARPVGSVSPPLILLDRAAAVARTAHPLASLVRQAVEKGVVIAVHDEAAARRGLSAATLVDGVKTVDLDELADLVAAATEAVVWL